MHCVSGGGALGGTDVRSKADARQRRREAAMFFVQNLSVTEIKNGAFEGCSGLATITVEAVKPPVISDDVFDEIAYNAKFIVPAGSEAAYKADENWKEFFKDETGISGIEAAMERTKVKKVFKNGKLYIGNYTTAGQRVL